MKPNELENVYRYETQMRFERVNMTVTTRKKETKKRKQKTS